MLFSKKLTSYNFLKAILFLDTGVFSLTREESNTYLQYCIAVYLNLRDNKYCQNVFEMFFDLIQLKTVSCTSLKLFYFTNVPKPEFHCNLPLRRWEKESALIFSSTVLIKFNTKDSSISPVLV